ncbi:hypothetical protein EVAR_86495_1 [Eumeta japonica]|uniref:Uncharacterized protein n=1 Tax=Eumeta variegata TaxID=151549 RepID=A0A4C1VQ82_EUMVA|nr:hypothetical protein EVAR_86495_1 [Eumeta japonica]
MFLPLLLLLQLWKKNSEPHINLTLSESVVSKENDSKSANEIETNVGNPFDQAFKMPTKYLPKKKRIKNAIVRHGDNAFNLQVSHSIAIILTVGRYRVADRSPQAPLGQRGMASSEGGSDRGAGAPRRWRVECTDNLVVIGRAASAPRREVRLYL